MLASDQVVKYSSAAPLQGISRQNPTSYFREGHWGQCLELLSHLCLHGKQHIVVIGPSGIGKTTMKRALEKRCLPNLHAVDDADNLPLDQILRLLEEPRLKMVLFAKPSLIQMVRHSTRGYDILSELRIIEVEPLVQKEMAGFLQYLWLAAGNEGVVACNKDSIRKIYMRTKGNPGLVKKIFSKQMFANLLRGRNMTAEQKSSKTVSPFLIGLGAAIGLGICLLALMWPASRVPSTVQQLPSSQTLVAEVPVIESVEPEFDSVFSIDAEQDKKLLELEQKMLLLQDKILQEQNNHVEVPVVDVEVEPSSPKVSTVPPTQTKAVQKTASKSTKNASKSSMKGKFSKDEHAILNKDKTRYTLQLVASSNEQRIKEFITKHKLAPHAKYYTSKRKSKPWYTVVYGDYSDKQSAMASAKKLPDAVKKLEPWARQYANIQESINKNHS